MNDGILIWASPTSQLGNTSPETLNRQNRKNVRDFLIKHFGSIKKLNKHTQWVLINGVILTWVAFSGGSVVKNPPASAEGVRDSGSTLGQEDPLEEEMVTHSTILAWKVPWTEKPGGLQSMGSVRHNWATKQQQQINLGGGLRSRVLMIPLWQVSVKSYVRSGSVLNDKLKPDSSLRKHLAEVEQDGKGWQTRAC